METQCASCEVRTGLLVLLQVASISQLNLSRLYRQCGILNISQPYKPSWPVTGIALLCFTSSITAYSTLLGLGHFSALSCTQSLGLLVREIGQSQGCYLHTGQHKHKLYSNRHPCFEWDSNLRCNGLER
jgi:hypothetical protein